MYGLLFLYSVISFLFSIGIYNAYIRMSEKDPRMITGTNFDRTLKYIFLFQYGTWYALHEQIRPSGIVLLCALVTLLTWYTSVFAAGMVLFLYTLYYIGHGAIWVFLKLFAYEDGKTIRGN